MSLLRSALGGLSGGLILGNIVRTLAQFSQSMSTLRAVTGSAGEEFDSLREKAKQLGIETRFSATQAADAMVFLARTGFNANQVLATIPATLQLAQVGMLEVARAADIASNVLKGFRLGVSQMTRVVDVLAKTSVETNTTVESLGDAMSFAAAASAALGISLEDTAAAVGVLGDAGIPASRAGAGLNLVFSKMVTFTGAAKAAIRDLRLEQADLNVETRGLIPVLETLKNANVGMADAIALVGVRQAKTLLIMIESLPRLKEVAQLNDDVAGTAKNLAEIMDDNLNGALLRVKSAFEGLKIALGDAGAEGTLRNVIEKIAIGLRLLARNADTLANVLAVLATVIGVKLVTVLIGALIPALATITASLTAMARSVLPTLAAAAIAAFAVLAVHALRTGQTLEEAFENVKGSVIKAFEGFIEPTEALVEFEKRFIAFNKTIRDAGGVSKLTVKQMLDLRTGIQGLILDMKATLLLQDFLAPQGEAAKQLRSDIELLEQSLAKLTDQLSPGDEKADPTKKGDGPKTTPEFRRFLEDLKLENELLKLGNDERAVREALEQARLTLGLTTIKKLLPEQVKEITALVNQNIALARQNELLEQINGPAKTYADTIKDLAALLDREAISQAQATEKTREARLAFLRTQKTFAAGVERAFLKMSIEAEDNAGRIERAITNAFESAGDALADFVETGKFDFNSLIKSIQRDLIELSIKGAITGPLGKILNGESLDKEGSGTFGGFGGLIGDIFGRKNPDEEIFGADVAAGGGAASLTVASASLTAASATTTAASATTTAASATTTAASASTTAASAAITTSAATITAASATTTASNATTTAAAAGLTGGAAALTGAAAALTGAAGALSAAATVGAVGGGGGGGGGSGGVIGTAITAAQAFGSTGVGFSHGGSFTVGGPGGTDRTNVGFKATRGETVTVKTPDQQRADGGSFTQNFFIETPDIQGFNRNQNQILGRGAASARNIQRRQ